MKVGDLVRLSAYGKKLHMNKRIADADPVGIIIKKMHMYHVTWLGMTTRYYYNRKDLKHASR